jgi:hypothetical protein
LSFRFTLITAMISPCHSPCFPFLKWPLQFQNNPSCFIIFSSSHNLASFAFFIYFLASSLSSQDFHFFLIPLFYIFASFDFFSPFFFLYLFQELLQDILHATKKNSFFSQCPATGFPAFPHIIFCIGTGDVSQFVLTGRPP